MKSKLIVTALSMVVSALFAATAVSAESTAPTGNQTAQTSTDKSDTTAQAKPKKKARPHSHTEWKYGTPDNRPSDSNADTAASETPKPLHDHQKMHK